MKFISFTASAAVTFLTFATETSAFWRMECRAPSGAGRIDPLVSPGKIAEHAHAIFGSGGFSPSADYNALMAGSCTSCSVAQDKSAYWTPSLYFKASDGQFTIVPDVGGMLAYYLLYPNAGETKVTAFPQDFQMIAGDTKQRNFTLPVPDPPKSEWSSDPQQSSQSALRQKAIGFNCLNYATAPEGSLYRHFLPDKAYLDANCLDGVRFELMFPSCWNGKDITSPNFKDHVAYPDLVMTGNCPQDFPVRLVSLFYETIYDTHSFAGQDGEFVISNGDPTGYGYHGDFMMGWDGGFLQQAVDTCTNPSGLIGDCPLFTIQDSSTYSSCKFPTPDDLKSEDLQGPMGSLPGNVMIQAGPGYAIPGGSPPAAATSLAPVPTLPQSAGSTIATGGTYLPGGVFAASSATPTPESTPPPYTAPPDPTPMSSPVANQAESSASLLPGQQILSTMYTTMGQEVLEVVMIEEEVTVTEQTTATETVMAGLRRKRNHLHNHKGVHVRGGS